MSVILDIDMPSGCANCPMFDDNGDYPTCIVTLHSRGYNFDISKRMSDCPLKEVNNDVQNK
jgi:hypothetical protein